MNRTKDILIKTIIGIFIYLITSCGDKSETAIKQIGKDIVVKKSNPVVYFEIPVTNIDRGIEFYMAVFNFEFDK